MRASEGKFYDLTDAAVRAEMEDKAPSIFSKKPSRKMTDKYNFISTIELAEALQGNGLVCVDYGQQYSRSRDPKFQEHLMRFRMPELQKIDWNVGDSVPEMVIVNSHNGHQALRCYAGIFRFICSNGLIISDEQFGYHRQKHIHIKDAQQYAQKHIFETAEKVNVIGRRINAMQHSLLSPHWQNTLANRMIAVRKAPKWLEPHMVLKSIRDEDEPVDDMGNRSLWQSFNIIQEHLIAKADEIVMEKSDDIPRTNRMRKITGQIPDFRLNGKFWNELEEFIQEHEEFDIPTTKELLAA